jgi:hypothetical protein
LYSVILLAQACLHSQIIIFHYETVVVASVAGVTYLLIKKVGGDIAAMLDERAKVSAAHFPLSSRITLFRRAVHCGCTLDWPPEEDCTAREGHRPPGAVADCYILG